MCVIMEISNRLEMRESKKSEIWKIGCGGGV